MPNETTTMTGTTKRASRRLRAFYNPGVQHGLLIGLLSVGILVPPLFDRYLEPIIFLVVVVVPMGMHLVRTQKTAIPAWLILTATSTFLIIYGAYVVGITLTPKLAVLFAIALLAYDIVGVQTGAMQSMNASMLSRGVPVVLLFPHSPKFDYPTFIEIVRSDGLNGLHGSDQGVTMLGIGDPIIPGALAVSCSSLGAVHSLGAISVTIPQIGVALGGIFGLVLLSTINLPRAIAALTMSVPGAILGLIVGVVIDPTASFWVL
jgi:presenilin-like A22 family membrane protease